VHRYMKSQGLVNHKLLKKPLDTLVDSIENRLREVVRLRGRTTKY
jgi:hypothetical protein